MMDAHRIFVEKNPEFRVEAESLRNEFNENLSLSLRSLRLLNVYDLFGFSDELLEKCGIPRPKGMTVFTCEEALAAGRWTACI